MTKWEEDKFESFAKAGYFELDFSHQSEDLLCLFIYFFTWLLVYSKEDVVWQGLFTHAVMELKKENKEGKKAEVNLA